jgi:hypothetical protein
MLILTRLMEHYDLRNCFLPDLSGLHVRIYQFRELLKQHLPSLYAHFEVLQVEPAYVSQWFLSFFAVTCPLPMLFRIYDVIFAEGASETIMRVALSLMQKNEAKILAATELEDVMQLLLSRGLWDCYHYNADEFVNDFVGMTGIVTHEVLRNLEQGYKESQSTADANTAPTLDIGSAASRFLGRLWAGSGASVKSANLSPGPRPVSFLRRSASKQSIASTLNSVEGGSESIVSSVSTDATSISRDSSNPDESSTRATSQFLGNNRRTMMSSKDKDLHGQIEDLLMALSELQRDHTLLASQLQREREEREEDRHAVRSLLDGLKKKSSSETVKTTGSEDSLATIVPQNGETAAMSQDNGITGSRPSSSDDAVSPTSIEGSDVLWMIPKHLGRLVNAVEDRFPFGSESRRSSVVQTKVQLRDELIRSKEQLTIEASKSQSLSRLLQEQEQEVARLKDQIREAHVQTRNAYNDKQRVEHQLNDYKARSSTAPSLDSNYGEGDRSSHASNSGLRELRLGRANSTRSQAPTFAKRTSSLGLQMSMERESEQAASEPPMPPLARSPTIDYDALVMELVQAKTAEAVARQEAEETKAKLESLKKMISSNGGGNPDGLGHRKSPSQPSIERANTVGTFSSYLTRAPEKPTTPTVVTPQAVPTPVSGGGFWGGWGKK